MKKYLLLLITGMSIILFISDAIGQPAPRKRITYNKRTERKYKGTVVKIIKREVIKGNEIMDITNLLVKVSDKRPLNVFIGPDMYFMGSMTFKKGDTVHILGSKMRFRGKVVVMARFIKNGDHELLLRDYNGVPLWEPNANYVNSMKMKMKQKGGKGRGRGGKGKRGGGFGM